MWVALKIKKSQSHAEDKTFLNFFLEEKIEKPVSWLAVSAFAFVVIEHLALPPTFDKYLVFLVKLLLTYNVIRICYMAAEAFGFSMLQWAQETKTEFDDQLAPFASRTLKVVVIIIGVLIGLQNFGINVTALLAGLGIGGVALAFAAQDTVANVFGTITIILDRPFKLGEHIKIGDTEGFVEEVGFRSTRIRTLYNSVVTIPNSVVAKERIDNLSLRNGWIRFRHVLGFTYDASLPQIKEFCEELRYLILQDARVDKNRVVANFNSYGDSSLNVLINFHFEIKLDDILPKIENEYLEIIHQTAEKHKLSFAYPTRTLLLHKVSETANTL
jgi:MscS family membrane protein